MIKNHEKGETLLLTLIVLTAMLFSTIALMRSTGVAGLVSGNLAFKDAAMHAADIGFSQAIKAIKPCGSTIVHPCGKATDSSYVSTTQLTESDFLTTSNWDGNALPSGVKAQTAVFDADYKVQYIIDRLSTGLSNIQDSTDVRKHSLGILAKDSSYSADYSESGLANTLLSVPAVFYRITVRVQGLNNTLYTAQTTATVANI
jgi:type IV pilus assembly protein PilX